MTVPYSGEVATSSFFCLYRLLFKWKGSIWQLVWHEYIVWLAFYLGLSACYRLAMTEFQREVFEDISIFCNTYSTFIPITFMLGFYVQAVFGRWQKIFNNIGWIDSPALAIAAHVEGTTETARNIRRNCVRYLCLCQALVFRDISLRVKKRFPTLNHLVTAGFMTETEMEYLNTVPSKNAKYWVPAQWVFGNLRTARQMGLISSDMALVNVNEKVFSFRNSVVSLCLSDWVSLPLAYVQVVHLAVRMFFLLALMGRQFLNPNRDLPGYSPPADIYIPIMSTLQFCFIVGWVKVAEVMLNPLGEDQDDFETNWILDRNLQVGLCMVDPEFDRIPPLERDAFWEDVEVEPLYTPETVNLTVNPQIGSCVNISPSSEDHIMLRLNGKRSSRAVSEDAEVVPVVGLQRRESILSRRGSIMSATRRLSAIVKNIKNKGRARLDQRRSTAAPSVETNCTSYVESQDGPESVRSREGSLASTSTAPEPINIVHLKRRPVPQTPRVRKVTPLTLQELSEVCEERDDAAPCPSPPPRPLRARTTSTLTEPTEEEGQGEFKRFNSWK